MQRDDDKVINCIAYLTNILDENNIPWKITESNNQGYCVIITDDFSIFILYDTKSEMYEIKDKKYDYDNVYYFIGRNWRQTPLCMWLNSNPENATWWESK